MRFKHVLSFSVFLDWESFGQPFISYAKMARKNAYIFLKCTGFSINQHLSTPPFYISMAETGHSHVFCKISMYYLSRLTRYRENTSIIHPNSRHLVIISLAPIRHFLAFLQVCTHSSPIVLTAQCFLHEVLILTTNIVHEKRCSLRRDS